MAKINPKSKKYLLIFVLSVLSVLLFLFYLFAPKPPTPPTPTIPVIPTPIPNAVSGYKNFSFPQSISQEEVIQILGKPAKTTLVKERTVLNYETGTPRWYSQVYFSSKGIELIIEPIFKGDLRDKKYFINRYGEPPLTLYGELSDDGKDLFAYPSLGIGILASNYTDIVYEIWYFVPTSNESFTSIAADYNYSTEPPEEKE